MKTGLLFWIVSLATTIAAPIVAAQDNDFPGDELVRRQVEIKTGAVPLDEYLVTMARAADVNIIADATQIPAASKVEKSTDQVLGGAIESFTRAHQMRARRFGERTFLFWKNPEIDKVALAHRIMKRYRDERAALPPLPHGIEAAWTKYFREAHGWGGDWETADLNVPLAQLPPELRARVHVEVQDHLFAMSGGSLLFQDEVWQRGRLFVGSLDNGKRSLPHLWLRVPLVAGQVTNIGLVTLAGVPR